MQVSVSANGWLLDQQFYLQQNLDVAAAVSRGETTAQAHWEAFSQFEGRAPNALFSSEAYLATNLDVAASCFTAVEHFLLYGHADGRAAIVDTAWLGPGLNPCRRGGGSALPLPGCACARCPIFTALSPPQTSIGQPRRRGFSPCDGTVPGNGAAPEMHWCDSRAC